MDNNSLGNKRCGSPAMQRKHDHHEPTKRAKTVSILALKQLYGKMTTSSKKRSAYMYWCAGNSFPEIAEKLSVAEATAQVYVIDLIASGTGSQQQRDRLLAEMEIGSPTFRSVESQVLKPGITLREIKDVTDLKYNQIRTVIAYLINDTEM